MKCSGHMYCLHGDSEFIKLLSSILTEKRSTQKKEGLISCLLNVLTVKSVAHSFMKAWI